MRDHSDTAFGDRSSLLPTDREFGASEVAPARIAEGLNVDPLADYQLVAGPAA